MILFDLDGTLLDSKYCILKQTKKEIRQLSALGVTIVLCSGRYPGMMKLYMSEIKANWMIAMNGAFIQSSDNQVLKESLIDQKITDLILGICNQYEIPYIIQNDRDIYFSSDNPRSFMIQRYNELALLADLEKTVIQPLKIIPQRIHKIMIPTQDDRTKNLLFDIFKHQPITVTSSSSNLLEITAESVNKGSALSYLAAVCGVGRAGICAFGDSKNDISMFQLAGYKIAMGNADIELKTLADAVIGTNDEASIAQVLARIRKGCL